MLRGVLLPAWAEEAEVDQADRRREHPFPGEPLTAQVVLDHLADAREHGAELQHPVMLLLVPPIAPKVVVAVLTAVGRVRADRLDVPHGIGADPDVLPGREDHQRLDAGERLRVLDRGGPKSEMPEPLPQRLRRIPGRLRSLRVDGPRGSPFPVGSAAHLRMAGVKRVCRVWGSVSTIVKGEVMPRAQIKDEKTYQELRERGESKEKSARIANAAAGASRSSVGKKGGKSGSYDDWSKENLVKRAREIGIKGRSTMTKSQLIKALRDH